MKSIRLIILFIFLLSQVSFAQPTWSDDIACIIYSNCSNCHTSNGIAPFDLLGYSDAYNNRYAIQSSVTDKSMPPWPPNQEYNELAHANILTIDEIDLINEWVNIGAPEGDPNQAPLPPELNTLEEIENPDFIVELPEYTVPNISSDLYKCFVVPTTFSDDKSIVGLEVIPGNRNIVHHVLVYQDVSNSAVIQDNNDPSEGFTCFGTPGSSSAELMVGWAPGSRARILPDGMGIPLPQGSNLVVQIHYPLGSTGETDQTKIRLKFADNNNLRTVYNVPILNHIENIDEPLVIQPNSIKSFHVEYTVPVPVSGISVAPHAHLICSSMRLEAELPSGEIVPLIDIPHWDFNWQGFYDLKSPVILPQGTKLHGYATYDNTVNNPNNPNNPPQLVTAGEATTDEMLVFYVSFLIYNPGDENLVFDNSDPNENDCETQSVGLIDIGFDYDAKIFPNPIKEDVLNIEMSEQFTEDYQVEIMDVTGRILSKHLCNGIDHINIPPTIQNGVYFCNISKDGKQLTSAQKIILMR